MRSIVIFHSDFENEFMSCIRTIRNSHLFDNWNITSVISEKRETALQHAFPKYQISALDLKERPTGSQQLIEEADIVISFLKGRYHVELGKTAFTHNTHYISGSGKSSLTLINEITRQYRALEYSNLYKSA